MNQYFQNTLFEFVIALILFTALVANAEPPQTTTSKVSYGYYHSLDTLERYHRLLPSPAPEGLYYHGRMIATANVDDTPEKETIVLIVVGPKPRTVFRKSTDFGNWHQAFLLIANTKAGQPKKKDLFKLFDIGMPPLEVPAAKSIRLHRSPFDLKQSTDVSFRLTDVTGDGTLDIWVKSEHGVALISFENGEFKEVFSNYTVTREKLTETPEIETYGYDVRFEPEGQKYHRFLAAPAPEGTSYCTRKTVIANIDDTPEKETIVLMVAQSAEEWRSWVQAFLLIAEDEAGVLKKKELFKLFDAGTHHFDVPGKTIEVQGAPFGPREWTGRGSPWAFKWVRSDLVDLTGDGILDLWVEQAEGVAVISFQNGEFKAVCSGYSSTRREDPIEYIDLDNDGIYEIKIPDRIAISGVPGAAYPQWMSLYKWDGNTYVLNNEKFYAENDEYLIGLLNLYNYVLTRHGRFDEYSFCLGLVFYYRGNIPMARKYLQWVANHAKKQHYVHTAEELLKKLPRP